MKKGRHSLVESVALKAPVELLYDTRYGTPPSIDVQRRGCGDSATVAVAGLEEPHSQTRYVHVEPLHLDVHLFKHAA